MDTDILFSANYDVFLALADITVTSLSYNIGFYFSIVALATYAALSATLHRVDKRAFNAGNFYKKLFKTL